MNVLQVCPGSYISGVGGVSEHVVNISERLSKFHDITVFATNPQQKLPWCEIKNNVTVERFRRFAPGGSYFISPSMLNKLRTANFDVVHGHSFHAFPMHYSSRAKCVKFIVSPHYHGSGHTFFRNILLSFFKPFGKKTLLKADHVIAVSEYEKELILKDFRLTEEKVVVIPNGVNKREFKDLQPRPHPFKTILFVGRLERYKGPQYLLEVLPMLKDNVVLDIVGKGPIKQDLEDMAKKMNIGHRVSFYSNLPRRELLQKYVDSDVFILLSEHEAYSLVVAEALAAKTPCIVTKTSALNEWVDDKNCFGIEMPVKLDNLADLIRQIISEEIKVKKSNIISEKLLDWDDVAIKLNKIYLS